MNSSIGGVDPPNDQKNPNPRLEVDRNRRLFAQRTRLSRAGQPPGWRTSRLGEGLAAVTTDSSRQSPRPGSTCPSYQTLPGKTEHGLLPDGRELPQTPQAETASLRSCPPGSAPLPHFPPPPPCLPANTRVTASAQPPSLSSGSGLARSKRPPRRPRQRGPLLRWRTQAPPRARGARRGARREGEFSAGFSSTPPFAAAWCL